MVHLSIGRCALFLDRDGVINEDRGWVHTRDNFVWQNRIFDLARAAADARWPIVVVTNQSGIARGLYTEQAFLQLTNWMCARFASEEAPITRVYHCPYHPDAVIEAYRQHHHWRKPAPGMLLAAAKELDLDLSGSILFGNSWSDLAAAAAAGVERTVLVGQAELPSTVLAPTFRASKVAYAIDWLISEMRRPWPPSLTQNK
jgi:D-glycero-D-manno-heptose 1,7-bisphosphate phosphatase